jgi:hypothetical protein
MLVEYADYAKTAVDDDYDPTVYRDRLGFVISQVANRQHRDCMYYRLNVSGDLYQPKYIKHTKVFENYRLVGHPEHKGGISWLICHKFGDSCDYYGGCSHSAKASKLDTAVWDARLYALNKQIGSFPNFFRVI